MRRFGVDREPVRGGAYINLFEDSEIAYRVDPGGDGVEIVALGPMELSIGMTPQVLERCQEVLAEAHRAVIRARQAEA
jgi:hypothetical protein